MEKLANANVRIDAVMASRNITDDAVEAHKAIRADEARERALEEEREQARARAQSRAKAASDGLFDAWAIKGNDALSVYNRVMPSVRADETLPQYKRRTLDWVARYLPDDHKYSRYDWRDPERVPLDVLPILAEEVFRDAKAAAWRADTVPVGKYRELVIKDNNTGQVIERRSRSCTSTVRGAPIAAVRGLPVRWRGAGANLRVMTTAAISMTGSPTMMACPFVAGSQLFWGGEMPVYLHNGKFGEPVHIQKFVRDAATTPQGPLPFLGGEGKLITVSAKEIKPQDIGTTVGSTKAMGLLSCAAIIYWAPGATCALVHHAFVGNITSGGVFHAIKQLRVAANNILVIYAHPNPQDKGYTDDFQKITDETEIGPNNVVEIPNLPVGQFGINNYSQIGC
jgi:hypothetical protein